MIGRYVMALLLWAPLAWAQTAEVYPGELSISVQVEEQAHRPLEREMLLLTIEGIYRRHITREKLVQPEFEGFSWAQLGPDNWRDDRLEGRKVKIFTRRMAIYPDRAGTLTIGAFRHQLTLTDEGDDWFDHEIASQPIMVQVDPAPVSTSDPDNWWFPVRRLQISDQWSNAPDQLQPGEGVLRIVRLEALGATPEMIPPMPELASPSGMVFPHPEKRLTELTPEGPVTYAFWRWTIRPTNATSTIVEPITFRYFDTHERVMRDVAISAQRVAYGSVVPDASTSIVAPDVPVRLPGWAAGLSALLVFGVGVSAGLRGREYAGLAALRRWPPFDPLRRELHRSARAEDLPALRRAALALMARDGASSTRRSAMLDLDRRLYAPEAPQFAPKAFAKRFLEAAPQDAGGFLYRLKDSAP